MNNNHCSYNAEGNRPGSHTTARRSSRSISIIILLAVIMSGCVSGPAPRNLTGTPEPGAPVWPPPPEKARITYLKSINGPADYGMKPPLWRRGLNFITGSDHGVEPFIQPQALAVDEAGNLCIADPGAHAVSVFENVTRRARRWTSVAGMPFRSPVSVAKSHNVVYVADPELGKVLAFTLRGKLVFSTGPEMKRPVGLALFEDNLLVADSQQHCLCVYNPQGKLLRKIGARGTGPGEFNFPTHVAVDPTGRIYVTDSMNMRVQLFTQSGFYLDVLGGLGEGSGHFSRPKGVAVDPLGHVYVVDALFDNIQIFDAKGTFLLAWGTHGTDKGEFWLPSGIAIDHNAKIFVADSSNRRVQIFSYSGGE